MHKKLLLSGVAALFWSIWLCRNDVVFNHNHIPSIIQVIFRGTYWFRFWRLLQKEETQQQILNVCQSRVMGGGLIQGLTRFSVCDLLFHIMF
jgi:hypothetical protein